VIITHWHLFAATLTGAALTALGIVLFNAMTRKPPASPVWYKDVGTPAEPILVLLCPWCCDNATWEVRVLHRQPDGRVCVARITFPSTATGIERARAQFLLLDNLRCLRLIRSQKQNLSA
jgi:hypothetical protein